MRDRGEQKRAHGPAIRVGAPAGGGEPVTHLQAVEALRIMRAEVQHAITHAGWRESVAVFSLYLTRIERYMAGE